ncbi:hypothetical protein NN561_010487 [Cricetulus griseus]
MAALRRDRQVPSSPRPRSADAGSLSPLHGRGGPVRGRGLGGAPVTPRGHRRRMREGAGPPLPGERLAQPRGRGGVVVVAAATAPAAGRTVRPRAGRPRFLSSAPFASAAAVGPG